MQDNVGDGLLMARRLAHFCPMSLSLEEIPKSEHSRRSNRSGCSPAASVEFIPPISHMVTEASSTFRVDVPPKRNRFGFLLEDIKPIEKSAPTPAKMRYELPNVKQVSSPGKHGKHFMVVSLSSTDLKGPAK